MGRLDRQPSVNLRFCDRLSALTGVRFGHKGGRRIPIRSSRAMVRRSPAENRSMAMERSTETTPPFERLVIGMRQMQQCVYLLTPAKP
jgi:hypothetical protein